MMPLFLSLFFGMCLVATSSPLRPAATDYAQLLEVFLNSSGQSSPLFGTTSWRPKDLFRNLKELDFYTTGRLTLTLPYGFGVAFELGGAGAGSPFLPLPAPQKVYVSFESPNYTPAQAQAVNALMKIVQNALSDSISDLGNEQDLVNGKAVDFFAEPGKAEGKKHPFERFMSFRMTPGIIFIIKALLLVKHAAEYYGSGGIGSKIFGRTRNEQFMQFFSYVADLGILMIRLARAWKRDSRAIGGMSAALEERAPGVGAFLRTVSSKHLPKGMNPDGDELYLHKKIDSFWRFVMEGGGLDFAVDGSIKKGLGFAVTGLECRTPAQAAQLAAFLSQPQINWDKIETQDMVGKPFIVRVATLQHIYAAQLARLPEEVRAQRQRAFEPIKGIIDDIILRQAEDNFGRYDLDDVQNMGASPQLKTREFLSLVGPDRPLGAYNVLPKVVSAGNYVYYCTNETTAVDAAKVVAVIFFQALWRYLEVMRGSTEMSAEVTARVKEKERQQRFAQEYLKTSEAGFLRLPLGLMLERPTVDFYAIAGQFFKDPKERENNVQELVRATAHIHAKAAARVGNLYREARVTLLPDKDNSSYPELTVKTESVPTASTNAAA